MLQRVDLTHRRAVLVMRVAVVGVCAYVASWLVSGLLIDGYSPIQQAISETFATGAPGVTRTIMTVSLLATGALLAAFGVALDRLAPGTGREPMWSAIIAGVFTMLVATAPCSNGCPGFATSTIDSLHVGFAAIGYIALIATPLWTAWRVRADDSTLAVVSLVMGTLAGVLFILANTVDLGAQGLVQRTYNTIADAWYVVAGLRLASRPPT